MLLDAQVERAPEVEGRQPSPDLLEDESLHDMVVPPELPPRWAPALPGTEGTPLRALIPGTPLPSACAHTGSLHTCQLPMQQQLSLHAAVALGVGSYPRLPASDIFGVCEAEGCRSVQVIIGVFRAQDELPCRRPAAGQDSSPIHSQDTPQRHTHAGFVSRLPLPVTHGLSSGAPSPHACVRRAAAASAPSITLNPAGDRNAVQISGHQKAYKQPCGNHMHVESILWCCMSSYRC